MRMQLVVGVIGGILAFHGIQEFRLSRLSRAEPDRMDLVKLEQGASLENAHLEVGPHWALYPFSIYSYKKSKYSHAEPTEKTVVNYVYYPIISEQHPFNKAWDALIDKYGKDPVPKEEEPSFKDFKVLVKTKTFKTVGEIPMQWGYSKSVRGLVINEIGKFDADEAKLIQQSWPQLNLDQILVVEEGRKPLPALFYSGMIAGGVVLILVAIGWFLAGYFKKPTPAPEAAPTGDGTPSA